jgi:methyl-accepting chemotaxis protein
VALRVVHPIFAEDGHTVLGYMELGQEIDRFLEQIRDQTGDDVALMLLKKPMDAEAWAEYRASKELGDNWSENEEFVVAGATSELVAADAAASRTGIASLPEAGDTLDSLDVDGLTVARGMFPVRDASGQTIGAVFVRHDITRIAAGLRSERLTVLAFVLGMLLLSGVTIFVVMDRLVFRRLNVMIEGMREISTRLAGGDFEVHYKSDGTKDEIGRFEEFFARFIDVLAGTFKQFTGKP